MPALNWDVEVGDISKRLPLIKSSEQKKLVKLWDQLHDIVEKAHSTMIKFSKTPSLELAYKLNDLSEEFHVGMEKFAILDDAVAKSSGKPRTNGEVPLKYMYARLSGFSQNAVEEWQVKPVQGTKVKITGVWTRQWADAKRDFEKTTARKKPAEKIFGAFRKSSGVEKSMSVCEVQVVKAGTEMTGKSIAALESALDDLQKVTKDYTQFLQKSIRAESGPDPIYREAITELSDRLAEIADHLGQACGMVKVQWEAAPYDLQECLQAFEDFAATVKRAGSAVTRLEKADDLNDKKAFQRDFCGSAAAVNQSLTALHKLAKAGDAPSEIIAIGRDGINRLSKFNAMSLAEAVLASGKKNSLQPACDQLSAYLTELSWDVAACENELRTAAKKVVRL
ncbi:MAG: hypothetical protein P4M00_01540 [Azospirillaceae bacterium]|nr:hypothetical protein [Azospirillaceae bacterium]